MVKIYIYIYIYIYIMIMIDEEKKLTIVSLSKTPKHERSSHDHTIANYEIHTNSEEKRDLLC